MSQKKLSTPDKMCINDKYNTRLIPHIIVIITLHIIINKIISFGESSKMQFTLYYDIKT